MTNSTKRAEHIPITQAEVRKALRNLIATRPDMVNPMREDLSACSYIRGRGKNIKRCIAGQIGYDFGLPTPPSGGDSVGCLTSASQGHYMDGGRGMWKGRFTDAARRLLIAVQVVADNENDPIRWGDISWTEVEGKAKVAYLPD